MCGETGQRMAVADETYAWKTLVGGGTALWTDMPIGLTATSLTDTGLASGTQY